MNSERDQTQLDSKLHRKDYGYLSLDRRKAFHTTRHKKKKYIKKLHIQTGVWGGHPK